MKALAAIGWLTVSAAVGFGAFALAAWSPSGLGLAVGVLLAIAGAVIGEIEL